MVRTMSPPADFLILRLSSFGDIVLTEPVTRALKDRYPDCRIRFLTNTEYQAIPNLFHSVDSVVTYSRDGGNDHLAGLAKHEVPDVVIDLQNNVRSRKIVREIRAKMVLRYRRQVFRRFLAVYLPWIWKGRLRHTVETYCTALRPLGVLPLDLVPRIEVCSDEIAELRRRVGPGALIGICPGGSSPYKRWGTGRFVELIRLFESDSRRVAVIGAEADRDIVESIASGIEGDDVSLYVGNDVKTIASTLSLCRVTVGNDSGLMHLAGAVGSRTVCIFGPTSPLLGFGPLAKDSVAVTSGLSCSPCSYHGNRSCRFDRRYCMESIYPAEIIRLVNGMIDRTV
jgi:heptosyltransferase-2